MGKEPASTSGRVVRSHRKPEPRREAFFRWLRRGVLATVVVLVAVVAVQLTTRPASAALQSPVTVTVTPWPAQYSTLSGIAAAVCRDWSLWTDIARDNDIADPLRIYPGQRVWVDCVRANSRASRPTPRPSPAATMVVAWVHPLPGSVCGDGFGVDRGSYNHMGQDMAPPRAFGKPIRAAGKGVVALVSYERYGAGWYVKVDHGRYWSVYMHMRARSPLAEGAAVKPGAVVGYVGSTGDSTVPHLHFEVRDGAWEQINPVRFMADRGVRLCG